MVVTYTDLAYFDDLLVDCLIDRLYYWSQTRKVREYKPVRGISQKTLVDIIQEDVINHEGWSVARAVERFVSIPSVKTFLGRFRDVSTKLEFERHVRRYLSIYSLDCGFGIEVTDRYLKRSKRLESCVIARKVYQPDEQIKYLVGYLSKLSDNDEVELDKGKDFSIINSSRRGANCLMLGPARFVNHDCQANARFVSNTKSMFIYAKRRINVGEEITVEYSPNYFGRKNRECLCVTCEKLGVNGFGSEEYRVLEDEDEDEDENSDNDNDDNNEEARNGNEDNDDVSVDDESRSGSRSRSGSVDTPTTSIEPESQSSLNSERGSEEPESQQRKHALRPRKAVEKKVVPQVLSKEEMLKRLGPLQRVYNSEPFKEENKEDALRCENCKVLFLPGEEPELSLQLQVRRYCPRCFRHAKLYNSYWPSMEPEEEEIEVYKTPGSEDDQDESSEEEDDEPSTKRRLKRSKSHSQLWKPAVEEEQYGKRAPPRRLSQWMLKRRAETVQSPPRSKIRRTQSMVDVMPRQSPRLVNKKRKSFLR